MLASAAVNEVIKRQPFTTKVGQFVNSKQQIGGMDCIMYLSNNKSEIVQKACLSVWQQASLSFADVLFLSVHYHDVPVSNTRADKKI